MTLEQVIEKERIAQKGRTRFEGQEPHPMELMLAEIDRLREIVSKLYKTADGVEITHKDPMWHPEFLINKGEYAMLWWKDASDEAVSAYGDFGRRISECYSSRAAAEAASKSVKEPTP